MELPDSPMSNRGHEKVGEHVRIFRRGANWYASFQHNKRQYRVALRTRSKKEARRRAAQIDVKLTSGIWKPAIAVVSIRDAVNLYLDVLEAENREPSTLKKYRTILQDIVEFAARLGIFDLTGLDRAFLDRYTKYLLTRSAKPNSAITINHKKVLLRQLIIFGLSRNMLAADPMPGLKMPKPKPTEQPCWTREETLAILAAADGEIVPVLTLLAELGLRFGEAAWLTWPDIDFQANRINIRPKPGWKPKTGDQRFVPMKAAVRKLLEGLPRTAQWVVPMPPSHTHPIEGRQWTERRLLSALKRVLKKLGLVGKLHTFRHSFISDALLRNTAVHIVRNWVGHVDPRIIDRYTHIHDAASQAAMEKLSRADGSAPNQE